MIRALYYFALFSLLFAGSKSFGTMKMGVPSGASSYVIPETGTPTIFGGLGGDICSSLSTTSTCNNCDDELTGLKVCNETRIHASLILTIPFESDKVSSPTSVAFKDANSSAFKTVTPSGNTASITWGELCTGLDSNCSIDDNSDASKRPGSQTGTLTLEISDGTNTDSLGITVSFLDPDPDISGDKDTIVDCGNAGTTVTTGGICGFIAYPGDEKIYITNLESSTGFPADGGITINRLRVFVNAGSFITTPNRSNATKVEDLSVETNASGNPELASSTITGLTNGTSYFVRVAVVDQANNVSRFTDDVAINALCTDKDNPDNGCIFSSAPDEVFGLLSEDVNCFITSVAYGSPLDTRVNVFREFRSKILRNFELGKKFIHFYYKKGPRAATWLHQNPSLKPVARFFLWPALGFAWTANNYGIGAALLAMALGVFVFFRSLGFLLRKFCA